MKILSLSVLAGVLATPAMACDLCSVFSAAQANGEIGKGFYASMAEQFTHFGTLQMDGVKVPNDAPQHEDSSVTQVAVGYNFNDRFGLQFNLPVIHRSYQRPDGLGGLERGTESGVGDVSLLANVRVLNLEEKNFTFRWTALGGVKLPSGDSRRLYEEVLEQTAPPPPPGAPDSAIHGHDLALGTGSVDAILGTAFYLRSQRFFFTTSVQYAIRTKGDFDYHYANDLTFSGGPGVYLALADKYTLAVQFVVSGEDKGRDTFQGAVADDTGITSVYIGPEVHFTWSEHLSLVAGFDLPVSINNTALQSVPDYRVRLGVTWHF